MKDKYESLTRKVRKLRQEADRFVGNARTIRGVIENLECLNRVSELEGRLYLNNYDSFEFDQTLFIRHTQEGMEIDPYDSGAIKRIMGIFAKRKEDPLAKKILEHGFPPVGSSYYGFEYYTIWSDIPNKLVKRTMTETEYEGYLNGDLPIYYGVVQIVDSRGLNLPKTKEFFLPKNSDELV
tara:strand:+ start:16498 stop:17040 length:543 start_codon:yes stop_codon:yes gene_type:complete